MGYVVLKGQINPFTVSKVVCVGRNYAEHAKEMKAEVPETPVLFLKPPSAIIHDGEDVILPPSSRDVHHEVEMTVLIGKRGKDIPPDRAPDHVAGYGVGLDMTLRDVQAEAKKKGLPWSVAKGFDSSAPLSQFVSASSVPDYRELSVELLVNGVRRQYGETKNFLFTLSDLLSSISRFFTLEPGDVIFTGTPEGVARVVAGDRLEARLAGRGGTILTSLHVGVREQ